MSFLWIVFLSLFCGYGYALDQHQLENAVRTHVYQGSSYGLMAESFGETLSVKRGKVSAPASLIKLFTSELSFQALTGDFQFQTWVQWQRGPQEGVISNLRLTGEGDPDFQVDVFVEELLKRGVTHINGAIDIQDNRQRQLPRDRDEVSDSGYCYNSLSNALNKYQNCVSLTITANNVRVADPDIRGPFKITRKFGTDYNSTRPHFRWLDKAKGTYQYEIDVSLKDRNQSVKVDVLVPATRQWMIDKITRIAQSRGIQFIDEQESKGVESESFVMGSRKMDDLMCETLTYSYNMVADSFFRVIPDIFKLDFFDDFSDSQFFEGTGLSRENFVTPESLLKLLTRIKNSDRFSYYLQCLPRGGKKGTLDDRLLKLGSRVALKTGSLGGISQLAGFIQESPETWTPFVFMYENNKQTVRKLRRSQDKVLYQIMP